MTSESVARLIVSLPSVAPPAIDWTRDLVRNLRAYAPTDPPESEEPLLAGNRLRAVFANMRRGADVSAEDRVDARKAGEYAHKVRDHACTEAAKLEVLFSAWRIFAEADTDAERECGDLIARFLRMAWRLEIDVPPGLAEGRKLASRVTNAAARRVLPDVGLQKAGPV